MRQIVIVGGNGGLGNALATQLLDDGYDVVVIGRANARDSRIKKFYRMDAATAHWPSLYETVANDTGAQIDAVIFVSGVAILSIAARCAVPFEAYYSASKAAAQRFLECLQLEYSRTGIAFISAFPGLLRTSFRAQSEWYGIQRTPNEGGADVRTTAEAVINLLRGRRKARVIGWRERSIDLADRLFPGLYDRTVLRTRVQKALMGRG